MYDSEVRKRTTKAQGKQEGLTTGRARGMWETEIPLLKGSCTNLLFLILSEDTAV